MPSLKKCEILEDARGSAPQMMEAFTEMQKGLYQQKFIFFVRGIISASMWTTKINEGYRKSESLKSYFGVSQSLFSTCESDTAFAPDNHVDNIDDVESVNVLMMIKL